MSEVNLLVPVHWPVNPCREEILEQIGQIEFTSFGHVSEQKRRKRFRHRPDLKDCVLVDRQIVVNVPAIRSCRRKPHCC